MLRVCGCLMAILAVASAQLMANMPQITKMDVQCAKTGMTVDIEFNAPFNGIIFSKGHFSDPACRYVATESNVARVTFDVSLDACGTNASGNFISNVIVIQNDGIVQEKWDSAHKLTCSWADKVTKTVTVRPLTIDMLEATEARFLNPDQVVDVWMDLQFGKWPESSPIRSAIRIGDTLSLLVGVQNPSGRMDLQVRDCHAHSSPEFNDPEAFSVQLTDAHGCVMKPKLLTNFTRQHGTGIRSGSTVNVAYLSAFAFPDNAEVFTSCSVEVCKGPCDPSPCQPGPSGRNPEAKGPKTYVKVTTAAPRVSAYSPEHLPPTSAPRRPTLPPTEYLPPPSEKSTIPPARRPTQRPQPTLPPLEYLPPAEEREPTLPPTGYLPPPTNPPRRKSTESPTLPALEYLPPVEVKAEAPILPPTDYLPPPTIPPRRKSTEPPTLPPVEYLPPPEPKRTEPLPTLPPVEYLPPAEVKSENPTLPPTDYLPPPTIPPRRKLTQPPTLPPVEYLPPPEEKVIESPSLEYLPPWEPTKSTEPPAPPPTEYSTPPTIPPRRRPTQPLTLPPVEYLPPAEVKSETPTLPPTEYLPPTRAPSSAFQPTAPPREYLPPNPPEGSRVTTFLPPVTRCFPGSTNPLCPTRAPPPPRTSPFTPPPVDYIPPTTAPRILPERPNCVFGSKDVRCFPATSPRPKIPAICLPGSSNPLCPTSRPQPRVRIECPPATPDCLEDTPPESYPVRKNPLNRLRSVASDEWPITRSSPSAEDVAESPPPSGDSTSHAFHMFHFQRSDGRRRLIRKNKRQTADSAEVRLTRSIRVLPPAENGTDTRVTSTSALESTFCLSASSLAGGATAVGLIFVFLSGEIILLAKQYVRMKRRFDKMAARFDPSRY